MCVTGADHPTFHGRGGILQHGFKCSAVKLRSLDSFRRSVRLRRVLAVPLFVHLNTLVPVYRQLKASACLLPYPFRPTLVCKHTSVQWKLPAGGKHLLSNFSSAKPRGHVSHFEMHTHVAGEHLVRDIVQIDFMRLASNLTHCHNIKASVFH